MIEPGQGAKADDFSDILIGMAKDNEKVSKKMAKAYIKQVNKAGSDAQGKSLEAIRKFLKIEDSLKKQRYEWVFGVPQVQSKSNFRTKQMQYGLEFVDLVSEEYLQFKCGIGKGVSDAFLGSLFKSKGRMDSQCISGLRHLVEMCAEDDELARYVYDQPAASLQ